MTTSTPLAPPAFALAPDATAITADIRRWVTSPALSELVAAFDGPVGAGLADLVAWSAAHWDFRAGKERNLVDPDMIVGGLEDLVLTSATQLGMVEPQPPTFESYDFVLMLGGLIRACLWRPEFAAALIDKGLRPGAVAAISGFRDLNGAELDLLPHFGVVGLVQEHQVMEHALRTSFGVGQMVDETPLDLAEQPNLRKVVKAGASRSGMPVKLVVAPSGDPSRRANTPDGYRFWATEIAHLRPGQRVLMVTSPIYVPFQHTDAVRILGLPYGCVLETVGIDSHMVDERGQPQVFRAVNYLQELNSMLRSLAALSASLA